MGNASILFETCLISTGGEPVVMPLKKFVGVRSGDKVVEGCKVTNSVKHTITYTRVDGRLLTHHVLSNGTIIIQLNSTADTGEYHCEAQTDRGLHTASFFGMSITTV